ncbi:DPP IV N-terminal domain-containing protein [Sphingobacterium sp. HMA12]|uniref:DPP IV N-terminal domain-containing protein n=1 Tax=Sphingobacterium sp. HMA12 TaxID=2050894 RepID=UPI000CE9EBD1|nr:DPP IV N-terminal domain-containing protein [Sphingobacterium sp. HMA12]
MGIKHNTYRFLLIFCIVIFGLTAQGQIRLDTTLVKPLPYITGWKDNEHYIQAKTNGKQRLLAIIDCKTGKVTAEVPATNSNQPDTADTLPLKIKGAILPLLSPDKKWIAYLKNNNLYARKLATNEDIQFTKDGTATLMNGYASWVYYEEILKRDSHYRAFWWSPDSKYIAFYRFDDSKVPTMPLYSPIGQHGTTEITHYPKAGDPNPTVTLGIASVEDQRVNWSDLDNATDHYLGTPFWRPDSKGLLVQWMPRRQDQLRLLDVNPTTGNYTQIYQEQQETWVDWVKNIYWTKDGFFLIRDFSGWEQIYQYSLQGSLKNVVTAGKNWDIQILRIDSDKKEIYFTASAENAIRTDLYKVRWDGRQQRRLTFGNYTHNKILLSPTGDKFITHYSNASTPTRVGLVNSKSGKVTDIADSRATQFDTTRIRKKEILWLKTDEGFMLPASVSWPKQLVKGKKYPVIIRIYGGPKYQTVTDSWVNPMIDSTDEQAIRVVFEHRGSGHNGKSALNYLYGNLGKWEIHDYISWVKKLKENPLVDPDRIFINGGSYGGYLTAMALTLGAEHFNYGIADYPVTDWRLYDSHYTERYMGLPKNNPDGYRYGSVLTHIDHYQRYGSSMLLIEHGLMDDNVHIQQSYQLVDLLQRKNKKFELMIYPTERHGWKGPKIPFTVSVKNAFQQKYLFNK